MTYVIDKLYLGDVNDALNVEELRQSKGITHILTLERKPLSIESRNGFDYLFVHALDLDNFDLLSQFENCLEFIDVGRKADGAVLVHCYAGQSRSATVVIAYVMQALGLTLDEALKLVCRQKPDVRPNEGFRFQLELFQNMSNRVDPNDRLYRKFRLSLLSEQITS